VVPSVFPSSSAPQPCLVQWAGESLELLPERALWWPARRVLFVADLHIGKAATYRALGQPVPGGTTRENLARLDALLARHAPDHIVFLGDFLHAAQARTPQVLALLAEWRAQHPGLAMTLVRGNHDSRAGDPPEALGMAVVDEPHLIGPFACCHHPQLPDHPTHFVLAGHLHPVRSLHGRGRDSLRMPCFVQQERQAILPAFGEFTGGHAMEAAPGRRFYAVGGHAVWAIPCQD
jgi:DNA ligase-associated metallophosphoesterase